MNTMTKTYNGQARNIFGCQYQMSYTEVKAFIEDAYAKRDHARDIIKAHRVSGTSEFLVAAVSAYRMAQKLSVKAYRKYMSDMTQTSYIATIAC